MTAATTRKNFTTLVMEMLQPIITMHWKKYHEGINKESNNQEQYIDFTNHIPDIELIAFRLTEQNYQKKKTAKKRFKQLSKERTSGYNHEIENKIRIEQAKLRKNIAEKYKIPAEIYEHIHHKLLLHHYLDYPEHVFDAINEFWYEYRN